MRASYFLSFTVINILIRMRSTRTSVSIDTVHVFVSMSRRDSVSLRFYHFFPIHLSKPVVNFSL